MGLQQFLYIEGSGCDLRGDFLKFGDPLPVSWQPFAALDGERVGFRSASAGNHSPTASVSHQVEEG